MAAPVQRSPGRQRTAPTHSLPGSRHKEDTDGGVRTRRRRLADPVSLGFRAEIEVKPTQRAAGEAGAQAGAASEAVARVVPGLGRAPETEAAGGDDVFGRCTERAERSRGAGAPTAHEG